MNLFIKYILISNYLHFIYKVNFNFVIIIITIVLIITLIYFFNIHIIFTFIDITYFNKMFYEYRYLQSSTLFNINIIECFNKYYQRMRNIYIKS